MLSPLDMLPELAVLPLAALLLELLCAAAGAANATTMAARIKCFMMRPSGWWVAYQRASA